MRSLLGLLVVALSSLLLVATECASEDDGPFLRQFISDHPNVHWSADGSHIVFSTDAAVFTYDLNTSHAVRVMGHTDSDDDYRAGFEFAPALSPDGKRLIFVTYRHSPSFLKQIRGHRNKSLEIVVADLDGSNYERLTDDSWFDAWPVFSPDGKQIAFLSDREGNDMGIYVMNADGSDQRRVTPPHLAPVFQRPAWFPTGDRLAFLAEPDTPFGMGRREFAQLYSINTDGSGLQSFGLSGALPAWYADGTRMAYATRVGADDDPVPDEGAMTLYTADADGSDPVRHGGLFLIQPVHFELYGKHPDIGFDDLDALYWGRDGNVLLVVNGQIRRLDTGKGRGVNLYVVDLEIGATEEVLRSSPVGSGFAISPDARFIGQLEGFTNESLFLWTLDDGYKASAKPRRVSW